MRIEGLGLFRRLFLHRPFQVQSLVRIVNVAQRHPVAKIVQGINGRFRENGAPEEKLEVRRDPDDLLIAELLADYFRPPLARSPEKKSPNCSRRTKIATGMMSPSLPVKSPSKSTGS